MKDAALAAQFDNYDWDHIFSNYTSQPTHTRERKVVDVSYASEDVDEILALEEGENDGPEWVGLFKMKDGKYLTVRAGCDYTGWGCQEDGNSDVSDTLEDAVHFGLTTPERDRLKSQLDKLTSNYVTKQGWIGVDLDGTVAVYDRWRGPLHIGAPIPKIVARIQKWIAEGYEVRLVTARASTDGTPGRDQAVAQFLLAFSVWSEKHIGHRLKVTCSKDFDMLELWDDRAVQVEENTGELIGRSTRGLS